MNVHSLTRLFFQSFICFYGTMLCAANFSATQSGTATLAAGQTESRQIQTVQGGYYIFNAWTSAGKLHVNAPQIADSEIMNDFWQAVYTSKQSEKIHFDFSWTPKTAQEITTDVTFNVRQYLPIQLTAGSTAKISAEDVGLSEFIRKPGFYGEFHISGIHEKPRCIPLYTVDCTEDGKTVTLLLKSGLSLYEKPTLYKAYQRNISALELIKDPEFQPKCIFGVWMRHQTGPFFAGIGQLVPPILDTVNEYGVIPTLTFGHNTLLRGRFFGTKPGVKVWLEIQTKNENGVSVIERHPVYADKKTLFTDADGNSEIEIQLRKNLSKPIGNSVLVFDNGIGIAAISVKIQ